MITRIHIQMLGMEHTGSQLKHGLGGCRCQAKPTLWGCFTWTQKPSSLRTRLSAFIIWFFKLTYSWSSTRGTGFLQRQSICSVENSFRFHQAVSAAGPEAYKLTSFSQVAKQSSNPNSNLCILYFSTERPHVYFITNLPLVSTHSFLEYQHTSWIWWRISGSLHKGYITCWFKKKDQPFWLDGKLQNQ